MGDASPPPWLPNSLNELTVNKKKKLCVRMNCLGKIKKNELPGHKNNSPHNNLRILHCISMRWRGSLNLS